MVALRFIRTMAKLADAIDAKWRRYLAGCTGQSTYATVYGRDWFGIWSNDVVIHNGSLPECRGLWSDIVVLADQVRVGMQQAEENGRRAGVLPGDRRDIRKSYGMAWPGWDR